MANKKTSELKDLEPLDRQTNDEKHERRDMREIPKTSIKKEQSHLMYLLEQHVIPLIYLQTNFTLQKMDFHS